MNILKAFDRDGDGRLTNEEMELAQAAFEAYDPSQASHARQDAPPAQSYSASPQHSREAPNSDLVYANQVNRSNEYNENKYAKNYSQDADAYDAPYSHQEPPRANQGRSHISFAPQTYQSQSSASTGGNSMHAPAPNQAAPGQRRYANSSSISFGGGDWDDPGSRRR